MTKIDIDTAHYDMSVEGGRIKRCTDSEAVAQNVRERLLTVQQEWFLDLDQGLPWFTTLTGRNVDESTLKGYISSSVMNTPGVKVITEVNIKAAANSREIGIGIVYEDKYNQKHEETI